MAESRRARSLLVMIGCAALGGACTSLIGFPDVPDLEEAGGVGDSGGDSSAVGDSSVPGDSADSGAADSTMGMDGGLDSGADAGDAEAGFLVAPPSPALQTIALLDPLGPAILAPTGNAGQRHFIYAAGQWWLFSLGVGALNAGSTQDGPDAGSQWLLRTVLNYDFGSAGSEDGRSFGVDTRHFNTADVIHFSLSSANLTVPLSHARATFAASTLSSGAPAPVLTGSDYPSYAGDGTVTSIGIDPAGTVADFTAVASQACVSCAVVSPNAELGALSWSWGSGSATSLGGPSTAIQMRTALSLPSGGFAFWRAAKQLEVAQQTDGGWGQASVLTNPGPNDDTRTFATCAQSSVVNVLSWQMGLFSFLAIHGDGSRMLEAAPPSLPALQELVLSCGPTRVHAFAIDGTAPDFNVIQGASWDPNLGWSPWVPVVDAASAVQTRCFLTGFDRVAGQSGDEVGLAWTEATNCMAAQPMHLFAAFVHVTD